MASMLAIKAFKQDYEATPETKELLETFRSMVNTCIGLGLEVNKTSRNSISKLCYHKLSGFKLHTWYRLYAITAATSALKGYRKAVRKGLRPRKPHIHKLLAIFGASGRENGKRIENGKLRLPITPRESVYIPLSKYVLRNVSDPAVRLCSVVLTASTLSISVNKNVSAIEPRNYVGIDINEDLILTASENGEIKEYSLQGVPEIISTYREVVSNFKRNDHRVLKQIPGKYGARRRNRVVQRLHGVSKAIVEEAVEKKHGIIMEKLTGIRHVHWRGNHEGRRLRHRLNSWPFHEVQRQIIYKASWNGIPTLLIDPRWTSKTCSECGRIVPKVHRWLVCHACSSILNRHENAARNILQRGIILARGVGFTPCGPPIEAMVETKDSKSMEGSQTHKQET